MDYRFMPCLVVRHQTTDELIPIWECDVMFDHGSIWHVSHPTKPVNSSGIIEGLYDVKTKKFFLNQMVIFREVPKYAIGESVGWEKGHHELVKHTIAAHIDGRSEDRVEKGKEIERYIEHHKDRLTLVTPEGEVPLTKDNLDPKTRYTFRTIGAGYRFEGVKDVCEWEYQLYSLVGF